MLPIRSLPVLQNWDCHSCTDCCREYVVHITPAEQARIVEQGWEKEPDYQGVTLFKKTRRSSDLQLNHRPDGACVFLNPEGGCRIHAKFGSAAKPLACRIYPFMLIPAGDHWRVGLRYSCPSVVQSEGRPIADHRTDLTEYASQLEERESIAKRIVTPPPLRRGQTVSWPDLIQFTTLFRSVILQDEMPLEWRIRKCIMLADLCRKAKFDTIAGGRLREFLGLIESGLDEEVTPFPQEIPKPTWIGRILFRQLVALYARKDTGRNQGISKRGRLALLGAAWRFARGKGKVPAVHALIPETTFEAVEAASSEMSDEAEQMLVRYYQVKLNSLQFCGPTNFGHSFWDGLDSLWLTYPVIMWLSRTFHNRPRDAAIAEALRMVDDNFGFNPLFSSRRQTFGLRTLSNRGEIAKLIACYAPPIQDQEMDDEEESTE